MPVDVETVQTATSVVPRVSAPKKNLKPPSPSPSGPPITSWSPPGPPKISAISPSGSGSTKLRPQPSITPAAFVLTPIGQLEIFVNIYGPTLKVNVLIAKSFAFGGRGVASVNDPVRLHSGGQPASPNSVNCCPVRV